MKPLTCARLESFDGDAPVLTGIRLEGDLDGPLFEARLEQRFVNRGRRHAEIVYTFPLPWGAVLMGVDVVIGGRRLSGAVISSLDAESRYEEALSDGDAAIMLERNGDDSHCLSLGSLAPGEECVVTLRYAQVLRFEQRGLRLLVPTVIAPRFGDPLRDGGREPWQTVEHDAGAEHAFSLELRLHGRLARARVSSPSHPIGVGWREAGADGVLAVTLARGATLDRDFVLCVDELETDGLALCAPDGTDGEVAVLVSLRPSFAHAASANVSARILVDCSGSMAGDSIEAARRALRAIVEGMGVGDRYSLSRFGDSVEHRSRSLWKAGPATRRAALRWIDALQADLGGTEMQQALVSTLALRGDCGGDLLLLTDGEIEGIDAVLVAARRSGQRVFVVGIGSSPAEAHLRRIAECTGGACDFVAPGEAVEPATLRMFARLRSERLSSLELEWPRGANPSWVSNLPASIFDGDALHVFARLPAGPEGEVALLGRSRTGETPMRLAAASVRTVRGEARTLARIVARARITSLEAAETPRSSAEARALALAYGLVTDDTRFLLVVERSPGEKASDMPELHKVRHMIPAGWGGAGSVMSSPSIGTRPPDFDQPAVFRNPRAAYAGHAWDASAAPASPDRFDIPAFLRRRALDDDTPDAAGPDRAAGPAPRDVARWLRATKVASRPCSFDELLHAGVEQAVVDWIEIVCGAALPTLGEAALVAAFVEAMASHAMQSRLLGEPVEADESLSPPARAIHRALVGITATDWPPQVEAMIALESSAQREAVGPIG